MEYRTATAALFQSSFHIYIRRFTDGCQSCVMYISRHIISHARKYMAIAKSVEHALHLHKLRRIPCCILSLVVVQKAQNCVLYDSQSIAAKMGGRVKLFIVVDCGSK